ncbi:MAG: rRNA pseudouridine synthase [Chloroflexi bacterium]|nr:MAG: rRNA pseudouridine synthase [Chloroflexota bacterium]
MAKERIQKLMAQAGIASRRASEKIIQEGRVTVNGKVVQLGDKADPATDDVRVDGEKLKFQDIEKVYYVFYKPPNVLSSNTKDFDDDRPTVRELIPVEGHLFTIGRLDAESEGMMILTNDGELKNKLSHPRYEHTKTYKVTVYGEPTPEHLEEWQNGVFIGPGEKTAPCYIKVLESNKTTTVLRIVMIEGKKRQIRRVASLLGYPVKKLVRTHIGELGLGTLKRGEWYRLSDEEVMYMSQPSWELELIRKRKRMLRQQKRKK